MGGITTELQECLSNKIKICKKDVFIIRQLLKEIPNITMYCDKKLLVRVRNKTEELEWEFTINTYKVSYQ